MEKQKRKNDQFVEKYIASAVLVSSVLVGLPVAIFTGFMNFMDTNFGTGETSLLVIVNLFLAPTILGLVPYMVFKSLEQPSYLKIIPASVVLSAILYAIPMGLFLWFY